MNTPWGASQDVEQYEPGIVSVSTASHGGVMITPSYAKKHLSEAAVKRALNFGTHYAFEEDCKWTIAAWELPHLWAEFFKYSDTKDPRAYLLQTLSTWHADYLLEIGVEPDPEGYRRFEIARQDRQMRHDKHPNLIVAARGEWHTKRPGVVEVVTADNKIHFVTSASYDRRGDLNLLSNCQAAL